MGAHTDAGAGARAHKTKLMADINITPMVDVMLVLLVIFMVTAPLLLLGVHRLFAAVMAIAADGYAGIGPVPADASDQPAEPVACFLDGTLARRTDS